MPKERSVNPAQAQRKAEKQKEIARNKKQQQNQRNEKLARRNPDRLQRQIDELNELESRGALRPKDKETLTQLEKDVRGIRRARDALGDAAPKFPSHERRDARREQQERRQHLGKRRRDEEEAQSSDTDPEVRDIPMPRDTPPPIPRQDRKPFDSQVPLGGRPLPAKPPPTEAPQLVYTSAPVLRDLKKEATRFVPAAVRQKQKQVKGQGRLIEPEEIERLEKAGYYAANKAGEEAALESRFEQTSAEVRGEQEGVDIEEEMRRFEMEMRDIYPSQAEKVPGRGVQMEEVEDEGD